MEYKGKRMRHVCSMKGCGNREVFLVTKNGEFGGGLYLCEECIKGLQKFIPYFEAERKPAKTKAAETKTEKAEKAETVSSSARRVIVPKSSKEDKE